MNAVIITKNFNDYKNYSLMLIKPYYYKPDTILLRNHMYKLMIIHNDYMEPNGFLRKIEVDQEGKFYTNLPK